MRKLKENESLGDCIKDLSEGFGEAQTILCRFQEAFEDLEDPESEMLDLMHQIDDAGLYGAELVKFFHDVCQKNPGNFQDAVRYARTERLIYDTMHLSKDIHRSDENCQGDLVLLNQLFKRMVFLPLPESAKQENQTYKEIIQTLPQDYNPELN